MRGKRWKLTRSHGSSTGSSVADFQGIQYLIIGNRNSGIGDLAGYASAAGACGEVALEIAMSSKLENRGLSKDGTFISLSSNPYNAYLYCAAPGSMSLRFLGPKPPVDDWYAFVSKTVY